MERVHGESSSYLARELGHALDTLQNRFRGGLIMPGSPEYEQARALYNAMIDKRPGLIARCADVADVIAAVEFAREVELPTAVRGGGHNGPGFGSCDDGLVIDLSALRGVRVDPEARRAQVAGGARWGDVDHATHAFGLATPSGVISTTGVGGLTLGGGHGYLSRKYGLSIDNLISADVVLADGRLVKASADRNQDLFWAIRGGGGNFGIVTSFEFELHPVDTVYGGVTVWPVERAREIMQWYDEFLAGASEDVYGFFGFLEIPPAPMFPTELHGQRVCGLVWCCLLEPAQAARALEPVLALGPTFEHLGPMPYPAIQTMFDPLYPPGMQWYWRGAFVDELPDEAIDAHLEYGPKLPSPLSTMHLYPVDGAVHRVEPDATAFSYRSSRWSQVIVGVDPSADMADGITRWTKEYSDALQPYTAGGAYVNFMMDEGEPRIRATYRDNYNRLAKVKAKYDPDNFFSINQNIKPE